MDEYFNNDSQPTGNGETNNTYTNPYSSVNSDAYQSSYSGESNSTYSGTYTNTNPYANANPYMTNKDEKKKNKKQKKEKNPNAFAPKFFRAVACGLAFGLFAGAGFYGVNYVAGEKFKSSSYTELREDVNALASQVDSIKSVDLSSSSAVTSTMVTTDVTDVVEKVMPSMVSVSNTLEETYQDFFGRSYTQESEASGSGIIIGENDTAYFIATNYHVIEDNVKLQVTFVDDTVADAYVKGYDEDIDIAVIAVDKENLADSTKNAITVAEIGDSDSLKMGEPAIAIGNALGYGQSVTTGVISALDRTLDESSDQRLIQTSAAINPGNSGGALLNIEGQVIGINSSKIGGDTVDAVGFAIPINDVIDIIGELSNRETKDVVAEEERGYLGIQGLSDDYYSQFTQSMGYPEGAYVASVYAGSPAEAAGIYKGDIITKCDGQSVGSLTELQSALSYYAGGDTVKLTVERFEQGEFKTMEIEVTLATKDVFNNQ